MKKLRWQILIICLTGLVVGILLVMEQPSAVSPSAAPEPVAGGVYTEALVGSLQRLNPVLAYYNQADRDINRLIFSGLLKFDGRGNPQSDLAETYGYSQDGTLYNVNLRSDAVWHDGAPVTAQDVVFTVELMRNGGGIVPADLQEFWKTVGVEALTDQVLQFRLPEAFAPFLDYLTFGVLPEHILRGKTVDTLVEDGFNLQPVGSGPFRFDKLLVEDGAISGVSLRANTAYYGQKPYLDQIVFRFYPDSAAAFQAYLEEQVQGISEVTPGILQAALSEQDLAVYTARMPELTMVMFNLKAEDAPFFQDKAVRKALYQGLNRQWMIDNLLQGQAILADGPILPGTWAYFENVKRASFDADAAKAALIAAGYVIPAEGENTRKKGEVSFSFTLLHPDTDIYRQIAERIQQDWGALNVDVRLEALPTDLLISERLQNRTYQAALVPLNLSNSPDPDPYPFWDQGQAAQGQNYTQWDNRVVSEYLEQARTTVDGMARAKLYRGFQVIFADELPALPLFHPVYSYAVEKEVQGVSLGPIFDPADRLNSAPYWFLANRLPQRESIAPTATP